MPTVLAVDDSSISRQIYQSVLKPHCEIVLVETAEQALEKISSSHFDLIITDVNLPGINGVELVRQLRSSQDYSKTPVIIISGDGDGIKNAKDIGADLWLLKPVSPQSLVKAVITMLNSNR